MQFIIIIIIVMLMMKLKVYIFKCGFLESSSVHSNKSEVHIEKLYGNPAQS